jgi:hypothetical protein
MKNDPQPKPHLHSRTPAAEGPPSAAPGDEVSFRRVAGGEYSGVDRVGGFIWELIQEPYRLGDLCEKIVRGYTGDDPVRCRRETMEFLRRLATARLITVC